MGGGLSDPFPLFHYCPSGTFPVAVFFLLSGYVIEISLQKLSPLSFLIARVFRLYPTFAVCLLVYLIVFLVLGRTLPDMQAIFSNLFLFNSSAVVTVSWTLIFEVRYYLAVALLAMVVANGPARHLIIIAAYAAFGTPTGFWLAFMSIGALMYYAHQSNNAHAFPSIALIVGGAGWYLSSLLLHGFVPQFPSELAAAIAVFAITATQIRSAAVPRALVYLGDISYPLYCIHYVVIVVIFYVFGAHLPGVVVQLLPLPIAIFLAHVLHICVEKPTNNMGKLIANWFEKNIIQYIKQHPVFGAVAAQVPSQERTI